MRELTGHRVNPTNDLLKVLVLDEPGAGGACHKYEIILPTGNALLAAPANVKIAFQNGPIAEAGINGITHEALLAILEDRLVGFQNGPYAHPDNEAALTFIRSAQQVLHNRTKERMARGVEGTHTV